MDLYNYSITRDVPKRAETADRFSPLESWSADSGVPTPGEFVVAL